MAQLKGITPRPGSVPGLTQPDSGSGTQMRMR
jgi:hypothetical protein